MPYGEVGCTILYKGCPAEAGGQGCPPSGGAPHRCHRGGSAADHPAAVCVVRGDRKNRWPVGAGHPLHAGDPADRSAVGQYGADALLEPWLCLCGHAVGRRTRCAERGSADRLPPVWPLSAPFGYPGTAGDGGADCLLQSGQHDIPDDAGIFCSHRFGDALGRRYKCAERIADTDEC